MEVQACLLSSLEFTPGASKAVFLSQKRISSYRYISRYTNRATHVQHERKALFEFILHEQVHSPLDNKAVRADTYFAWSVRTKHSGVDLRPPTGADLMADKKIKVAG